MVLGTAGPCTVISPEQMLRKRCLISNRVEEFTKISVLLSSILQAAGIG